jgi:tRNA 2-thiouridine synthesizing protein B
MSTLHTVNKSPFTHETLASCLAVCTTSDSILLLEDGVYGALANSPCANQITARCAEGVKLFALEDDVQARGLREKLSPEIQLTDYKGFVELSLEHRCVQSWY